MSEKPKSNRGGKRPNAGAKPKPKNNNEIIDAALQSINVEVPTQSGPAKEVLANQPIIQPKPKPTLKPIERKEPAIIASNLANSGVLLLALGDGYYGKMAFNLAATLKASNRDIHIHLVHTENSLDFLNASQKSLFDSTSLCPAEAITKNGKQDVYFKAKTFLYDLTPFENTLYLDVDMAWLYQKSITEFITNLSSACDFTIQNKGLQGANYLWANEAEIKKKFPEGKLYNLYSELIFFKKSEANKKFFETAKKYFDSDSIDSAISFNGDVADELAFALAMMELNYYPHQENYKPIFWKFSDGNAGSSIQFALDNGYYGYSAGGNFATEILKEKYESLVRACVNKIGIGPAFKLVSKKRKLPNRKTM